MPKAAARISTPVTSTPVIASASSEKSDSDSLVSVSLFSGSGLLISLIGVIMGVQSVWY